MKWYNEREAVVVPFKVRKDGEVGQRRNRYRKTWILKSVLFTLDTESPTPAPPLVRRLGFGLRLARAGQAPGRHLVALTVLVDGLEHAPDNHVVDRLYKKVLSTNRTRDIIDNSQDSRGRAKEHE